MFETIMLYLFVVVSAASIACLWYGLWLVAQCVIDAFKRD